MSNQYTSFNTDHLELLKSQAEVFRKSQDTARRLYEAMLADLSTDRTDTNSETLDTSDGNVIETHTTTEVKILPKKHEAIRYFRDIFKQQDNLVAQDLYEIIDKELLPKNIEITISSKTEINKHPIGATK
jgi:hypothetical protein